MENIKKHPSAPKLKPEPDNKICEYNADTQMTIDVAGVAMDKARLINEKNAALCLLNDGGNFSSEERLVEQMPSVPLTREGYEKMSEQDPAVLERMVNEQIRIFEKIGKVLAQIDNTKKQNYTSRIPTLKKLYRELQDLENSYTLLETFHRANRQTLMRMPIPSLELKHLEKVEQIQSLCASLLGDDPTLKNIPYFTRKKQEIVEGFAEVLANQYDGVSTLAKVIKENPEAFKQALSKAVDYVLANFGKLSNQVYNKAIDATEEAINNAVESEGESLARNVGFALGEALNLFVGEFYLPASITYLGLKVTAKSTDVIGNIETLNDTDTYTRCVEKITTLFPDISVISARALTEHYINEFSNIDIGTKADFAATIFKFLTTNDVVELYKDKKLLRFIVDGAYTLPQSMVDDIMAHIVAKKIPLINDEIKAEPTTLYSRIKSKIGYKVSNKEEAYTLLGLS